MFYFVVVVVVLILLHGNCRKKKTVHPIKSYELTEESWRKCKSAESRDKVSEKATSVGLLLGPSTLLHMPPPSHSIILIFKFFPIFFRHIQCLPDDGSETSPSLKVFCRMVHLAVLPPLFQNSEICARARFHEKKKYLTWAVFVCGMKW